MVAMAIVFQNGRQFVAKELKFLINQLLVELERSYWCLYICFPGRAIHLWMFHIHRIYHYCPKFKMAAKMAAENHFFSNSRILVTMPVRTCFLSRLCYIEALEFTSSRKTSLYGTAIPNIQDGHQYCCRKITFSHVSVNLLYMDTILMH